MTTDDQNPSLPLTSGEQMPVFQAVRLLSELRQLRRLHPEVYRHLVAVADGHAPAVPPQSLPELRERTLIDPATNAVMPELLNVLTLARRASPDGEELVNPLVARTPAERASIRQAEAEWEVWGQQIKDILNGRRPIPRSWVERLEGRDQTRGGGRLDATLW